MNHTKQVQPQAIEIGQYWECVGTLMGTGFGKSKDEVAFNLGDLVVVVGVEPDHVRVFSGDNPENPSWNITYDEFDQHFNFAPDGAERRALKVAQIETSMFEDQAKLVEQQQKVALLPASTDDLAEAESQDEAPQQPGLIRRLEPASIEKARQNVQQFSNDVQKYGLSIQKKQKQMELILEERQKAIAARLESAKKMIGQLQEAMLTFDVYLGKGEHVREIVKGKPSPADELITIRQLTLYMDEETAIGAEFGGLDFQNIASFDEWVKDPANLQQVLPEPKGIVAIMPRRDCKDYGGDPWSNMEKNRANKQTYWLIRNGENVYRVITLLDVGDHIVPFEDEYLEMFGEVETYKGSGRYEKRPIKPGDREYMQAMERADARKRHYMRILLLMQGLIDRTDIFKPYPHNAERINVMDERHHQQYVRYVYDADPKRLLTHGRASYEEWVAEINQKLDKGIRVIGVFNSYAVKKYLREGTEDESRTWPRFVAKPNDLEIYTVERREGENYIILYDYEKNDWSPETGRRKVKAEKRASWRIEPGDLNVLAIDFADVADMEFYLKDRLNRSSYSTMFPLLKTAIAVKRKEAEEEAPFRKLLAGMLMARYHVNLSTATDAVDELVPWWKFKNRTHRSLKSNEKGVINTILDEYGLRQKKNEQRDRLPHNLVVEQVKAIYGKQLLYVGHKIDREYVVLVAANEHNVFVSEYTYGLRRDNTVVPTDDGKHWKTVDKRRWRWMEVYKSERWDGWAFDVRPEKYLTDPEIEAGFKLMTSQLEGRMHGSAYGLKDEEKEKLGIYRPLAITYSHEDGKLRAFVQTIKPRIPKYPYDDRTVKPHVPTVLMDWYRVKGEVRWNSLDVRHHSGYDHWWDQSKDGEVRYNNGGTGPRRILFIDEKAIAKCDDDWDQVAFIGAKEDRIDAMVRDLKSEARDLIAEQIKAEERAKFLAENNNDVELWELTAAKEKWTDKAPWGCLGTEAVIHLMAREIDCNGKTLGECLRLARKEGWSPETEEHEPTAAELAAERAGKKLIRPVDRTPVEMVVKYEVLPPAEFKKNAKRSDF